MYIPRTISAYLENIPKQKAILLFGPRQVGKTTLLEHLYRDKNTKWLTGDNMRDVATLSSLETQQDLLDLLNSCQYLVIDEAQRIPSIGLFLKRMVDAKTDCRIIATGSSCLELAGGTYESAAGRIWPFTLWPFSIGELAESSSWFDVRSDITNRLIYGGYPAVINHPEVAKKELLTLFDSMAFKDIFILSGMRHHEAFLRLVKTLAFRIGNLCSYDSLAKDVGLNAKTVEHYLTYLEQCFIIRIISSYSTNLDNELKKSKKIYFCDVGIRNAALGDFSPFSMRTPEEQGALFENFFVMERIKQANNKERLTQHYFWRSKAKAEVDLVEVTDKKMEAFEVKLSKDKVSAPLAFSRAYPKASFHTVNLKNFYSFFQN